MSYLINGTENIPTSALSSRTAIANKSSRARPSILASGFKSKTQSHPCSCSMALLFPATKPIFSCFSIDNGCLLCKHSRYLVSVEPESIILITSELSELFSPSIAHCMCFWLLYVTIITKQVGLI